MDAVVSRTVLERLSAHITAKTGLFFSGPRMRDLERSLGSIAIDLGHADVGACIEWLLTSPLSRAEIDVLAGHLTVGETYFFRDRRVFRALEEHILPDLIRQRQDTDRRIRIWSAGCCTGEEPYSIAMLLSRLLRHLEGWNITLLGTDINRRFLQRAAAGRYTEWSFRETTPEMKVRYFRPIGSNEFEIVPEIRSLVSFSYLNLAEDAYPSLLNQTNAMDIILCRNVLMYFEPEHVARVSSRLRAALVEGGWLIVSPSEASHALYSPLTQVEMDGAILYRNEGGSCGATVERKGFATPSWGVAPDNQVGAEEVVFQEPCAPDADSSAFDVAPPPPVAEPALPPRQEDPPETPGNAYERALACYADGRYDDAFVTLGESPAGPPEAMRLRARIRANQGKFLEALEWCDKALEADRLEPSSHYLRSVILQEQGDADGARTSLRHALYLDQDFIAAHFALGGLARREGNDREMVRHWENALSLLGQCDEEELLPESDGIAAGRLREILQTALLQESMR